MGRIRLLDLVDGYVRARPPAGSRRGVLLVSSGGLGDTILFSLAVPRFVELARDGEPVDVLVRADTVAAAFLFPPGVTVKSVDYRRFLRNPLYRLRTSLGLRERGYRVAVSTDHLRLPTVDDALIAACGAEQSLALAPRSWPKHDARLGRNRAHYDRWVEPDPGMAHRMVRWIELANGLTGNVGDPPVVRFPADRLPPPRRLERPTVVLHPFSAIPERQHPEGLFRRIVESLPAGHDVVLSAGPGDLDRGPEFRSLLALPGVVLDDSGLEDKAALVRAARLVVSVDTSLMHLAVGAGAPTLCLASAAHVVDSIPYDPRMTPDNVTFLYHDMDCRGCLGTCIHPLEDGRYPCVARIDPETAVQRITAMLARGRGP